MLNFIMTNFAYLSVSFNINQTVIRALDFNTEVKSKP